MATTPQTVTQPHERGTSTLRTLLDDLGLELACGEETTGSPLRRVHRAIR